jgi:hypothetical protein
LKIQKLTPPTPQSHETIPLNNIMKINAWQIKAVVL